MDLESARINMVQKQIRSWNVHDQNILNLLTLCPRERFVPSNYQQLAFADIQIPLGHDQVMLQPSVIGRILIALDLEGTENILEIGTGSGYLTALLAQLGRSVTSIEINGALAKEASNRIQALGLNNVEIINGDAFTVLHGSKGFEIVVLTGSVQHLPRQLINQTKIGGFLFAIVGTEPVMQACIFTRIKEEEWSKTILFETVTPPLRESLNATTFEF